MKNSKRFSGMVLMLLIMTIVSCKNVTVSTGDGSEKIEGNGKVTVNERKISSFNQVEIDGVFNVFLTQSDKESIKVETDENIQPLIISNVENGVLLVKIKEDKSIKNLGKINVYISLSDITRFTSNGVGTIKCSEKIKLNNLELICKGVGATELNVSVNDMLIDSEIVGALILSGDAKNVVIRHKGLGIIQAFGLKTENLSLNLDGIGAAEVYASNELNIRSRGLGGIKYKGNPKVKNIKNDGIGKVESED